MMIKRKIKHVSELPDWFSLENYKTVEKLGLFGWMRNLMARHGIVENLTSPYREAIPIQERINAVQRDWEKIKSHPVEADSGVQFGGGLAAIEEITPYDLISGLMKLGREKLQVAVNEVEPYLQRDYTRETESPEWFGMPLSAVIPPRRMGNEFIKVNPRLPDDMLIENFKDWLKELRKSKKDEHAKTHKARKANLSLWVSCGVLPYIDLSIWATIEGVSIPDRVYADAVFPYGDGGEDKIRKTTAPLARELVTWESVHSLIDQFVTLPRLG